MDNIFNDLKNIIIKKNEELNKYTFTRTGGKADYVIFPKNNKEVVKVVKFSYINNIPLTIIGNASNLIVKDGGIRGIVMILTKMNNISLIKDNKLIASSGAKIIDVSEYAYRNGLSGLEFAAGIPGSVGGAAFMNAGAYGGEMSDVITEIEVMDYKGNIYNIHGSNLNFGYRWSVAQEKKLIVLSAIFSLTRGNKEKIRNKMDYLNFLRVSKQPLEYPSCGSVFKRPKGYYTGPLIQKAGLQGINVGGAQISTKHAGFIVNVNKATATDYLNLILLVQNTIKKAFDVSLETEVRIIGNN